MNELWKSNKPTFSSLVLLAEFMIMWKPPECKRESIKFESCNWSLVEAETSVCQEVQFFNLPNLLMLLKKFIPNKWLKLFQITKCMSIAVHLSSRLNLIQTTTTNFQARSATLERIFIPRGHLLRATKTKNSGGCLRHCSSSSVSSFVSLDFHCSF